MLDKAKTLPSTLPVNTKLNKARLIGRHNELAVQLAELTNLNQDLEEQLALARKTAAASTEKYDTLLRTHRRTVAEYDEIKAAFERSLDNIEKLNPWKNEALRSRWILAAIGLFAAGNIVLGLLY